MTSQICQDPFTQICQDVFISQDFKKEREKLLEEVKTPDGWRETYQLREENPTYNYRLGILNKFIDARNREGYTVNDKNKQEFFRDLRVFLYEEESHCSDEDLQLSKTRPSGVDLFEKNWKIEGVVVRKSGSRACLLFKAPRSRARGPPKQNEMVLSYKAREFPGLGLSLKVGDILCVTKNQREVGKLSDPELVRYANIIVCSFFVCLFVCLFVLLLAILSGLVI